VPSGELFLRIEQHIEVKIDSVAFGGEGVGRVDNLVVFVPFSAPGDELEIEITQRKKKFARGKIIKIVEPSEARETPLCRYYGQCGGCCYQHIKYESQLVLKKKQVIDAFEKIGGIAAPPVGDIVASPKMYHYRGKAQLHAARVGGGVKIGFMDVSGGRIVDIGRCEIVEESINGKIVDLRTDELLLACPEGEYTIWSGEPFHPAGGKERVSRLVKSKEFLAPYEGFFQANLFLIETLVDEVCRAAEKGKINTLIDAYCGCGLFSVFLARCADKIIGMERDAASVKCARINAENAQAKNVEFTCGRVEKILSEKNHVAEKIDMIVLDPPRAGCGRDVMAGILELGPEMVVYISCNPATAARDVKCLHEGGYELLSLLPLDMFPQTQHIEIIAVLAQKQA